jgi:hypothetical protein
MGNITLAVEDARDVWAVRVLDAVQQDVRTAIRGLRKSAGFSAVVIGTLALGIGANTSLFSIFNSLIMRPLPVRDPGSLALLTDGSWSYPVWQEIRAHASDLFDGAFAWSGGSFDLALSGRAVIVDGEYVSGHFFDVLGVPAFRGRMLTPADDSAAPPNGPVAVISHRFWRQHFGGADDVVGRQLTVQRLLPFTIVGVMPPGFSGVDVGRMADVMLPFSAEPLLQGRESQLQSVGTIWLQMMVRLKPGQTIEHANAALRGVQPQIRDATLSGLRGDPAFAARYLADPFTLAPAAAGNSGLRRQFETPLFAMVVAVGLVLLVAIVNDAFARRYLPGQQPIGQTLRVGSDTGPRYEIVGLAADAVCTTPRDGMPPQLYVPPAQRDPRGWNSWGAAVLTIQAVSGQRALVERDVAAALTQAHPNLVFTSGTFDQMVEETARQERLVAMMSGFFGALALLLAGLGLYGVVAQAVGARRTEIGLRMALGAQPAGIVRLVFRRVGVFIVAGLAVGLAGSWWAVRFIAPLLFQVEARDPMTFSGTAAVLVAVGVLAAWVPARRAARLDPATVLREG